MYKLPHYPGDLWKRKHSKISSKVFPYQQQIRKSKTGHRAVKCFVVAAIAIVTSLSTTASADQFTLNWTDNSDNEDGFVIERSIDGSSFTQIDTVDANITSYTDANLAPSTTYSYRVNAYNNFGTSGYTNTASGTTASPNTPPSIDAVSNQTTFENENAGPISLTVFDAESPALTLSLTATSSNQALVPNENIALTGSGSSRMATIAPSANQVGAATISVTVSDGTDSASSDFLLTVEPAPIPESDTIQIAIEGFLGGSYEFGQSDSFQAVVSGEQSAIQSVELYDNGALVNADNDAPYEFTFTANVTGDHLLKAVLTTGMGVYEKSFSAFVADPPNTAPAISVIGDHTIEENTIAGPISFNVSDAETLVVNLSISATSSDATLVPEVNITLTGNGSLREISIAPSANHVGATTITVTVSDGTDSATADFLLTVEPAPIPEPPSDEIVPADDPNLWLGLAFDEESGSSVFDVSDNINDGSITTGVTRSDSGQFGRSLDFDGSAGAVDLGYLNIPGSALTIAAWIRPDSFGVSDARIVSKATDVAEDDHIWMLSTINSGGIKLRFRLNTIGTPTSTLIGATTLPTGEWSHVAATYDGAAMRLYINGILDASRPRIGSIAQDPAVPAAIGDQPQGGRNFDGLIDDFRIYLRALDESELSASMGTSVAAIGLPDAEAPDAPHGLNATLASDTETQLSWVESTDNKGVLGYLIYRDGIDIGTTAATSFLDVGLDYSTTYVYTVTAFDEAGNESTPSVPVEIRAGDPPATENNAASNGGFESGMSSWTFFTSGSGSAIPTKPGYTGSGAALIQIDSRASNIQLYQNDLRLEPNTEYQLTFAAYSNTGHDLRVSLSKHSSPYTNYGINRERLDLTTQWQTFSVIFTTQNFKSHVDDGRLYFWLGNDARAGDLYFLDQIVLSQVSAPDLEAPNAPPGLNATLVSDTEAQLSWGESTDNVGVLGYLIYRDGTDIGSSAENAFLDQALDPSTTYAYTVTAFDEAGNESAPSTETSVGTPPESEPPSQPQNLQALFAIETGISLSWTESIDNVGVTFYRVLRNGEPLAEVQSASYVDGAVDPGKVYSYHVVALVAAGNVSTSSESVEIKASNPPVPETETVSNGDFESGMSSWSFYTNGSGSAAATGPGYEGASAAVLSINTRASNIQLYQNDLLLESNTEYELTFVAYSNSGHDLRVSLAKHDSPYTNYGISRERFDLTTQWQTFTVTFTTRNFNSLVDDGRLYFWLGDDARAGDQYFIDQIVLAKK